MRRATTGRVSLVRNLAADAHARASSSNGLAPRHHAWEHGLDVSVGDHGTMPTLCMERRQLLLEKRTEGLHFFTGDRLLVGREALKGGPAGERSCEGVEEGLGPVDKLALFAALKRIRNGRLERHRLDHVGRNALDQTPVIGEVEGAIVVDGLDRSREGPAAPI
eukprot:scaffold23606_cov108-Isochrysis_galbana.AAC.9